MDSINIKGLKVFAYHGVFEEEKRKGQNFYIDATLFLDLDEAGRSDDLSKSVNYGSVSETICEFVSTECFDLIETVALKTAEKILIDYPLVDSVSITVHKPSAPIDREFEDVSICMNRGYHKAYIALGSNMGDREAYINNAINALSKDKKIKNLRVSKLIKTEPYGGVEQEEFLNGAAKLSTLYSPKELLSVLQSIEKDNNRERKVHWGPRTLDLDILFYDDICMYSEELNVPHIDMQNRRFVLEPLMELCPSYRSPANGCTVKEMYDALIARENA